jgi:lysophospholipase L1-like esterase
VLVIGDSLAVGMQDALRAALPGWRVRVDARIGRPLAEGMRVLGAQRDVPAILAMSLFTNDDPGATQALEQAVRATAGRSGGCAVWATIVRPPYNGISYAAANGVLVRLAGDPQLALGLRLVDWRGAVAQSPSYLAGDGVHGTPEGYRARGELYAAAIRACAGEA